MGPIRKVVYLYIPTSNHNCPLFKTSPKLVVYLYIPTSNHNTFHYRILFGRVVYLYIPTSNHNPVLTLIISMVLYIFIFLHQTTTVGATAPRPQGCISLYSYIKPQQYDDLVRTATGCISLYSYIKPQLILVAVFAPSVVYLYIPTSNHNAGGSFHILPCVVYLYIPTSNHNVLFILIYSVSVVYLYIPTSNHNS